MLNLLRNKLIQHYTFLIADFKFLPGRVLSPIATALYPWSLASRNSKPAHLERLSLVIAVASLDTSNETAVSIWQSSRQSGQATVVAKDKDRPRRLSIYAMLMLKKVVWKRSQKTDSGAVVGVYNLIDQKFADNSRGCTYGKSALAC